MRHPNRAECLVCSTDSGVEMGPWWRTSDHRLTKMRRRLCGGLRLWCRTPTDGQAADRRLHEARDEVRIDLRGNVGAAVTEHLLLHLPERAPVGQDDRALRRADELRRACSDHIFNFDGEVIRAVQRWCRRTLRTA